MLSLSTYIWYSILFISKIQSFLFDNLWSQWFLTLILLWYLYDQFKFVFWYTRRTPGVRTQTSYEDNIKKIVEFSTVRYKYQMSLNLYLTWSSLSWSIVFICTLNIICTQVEGFWVSYCHLARPASLPSPTDLHLFKEGIRPLWEVYIETLSFDHFFPFFCPFLCFYVIFPEWRNFLANVHNFNRFCCFSGLC